MQDFDGKVAVVTGTGNPRGIGYATCKRFAELGCRLVLSDLDSAGIDARVAELRDGGTEAIAVAADMGDRDAVERLAAATYDEFGAAHILLLNHVAPTGGPGHGLLSPEPDSWELHARVNLLGAVYGIKAFVPRMIAGGEHGHVLATTSGAGASGTMYGNGPYAVTKAAITSLMECLHGQLRDADADIVAGLVFPPVTATQATDEIGGMIEGMLRSTGVPATLAAADEVAVFTIDAIRRDSFWAHPDVAGDHRLTGGRHRETIDWEDSIYRIRAATLIERTPPDAYLWGPRSDVLGP